MNGTDRTAQILRELHDSGQTKVKAPRLSRSQAALTWQKYY